MVGSIPTASIQIIRMRFAAGAKNRQQKMVRLVTEPPENNCWMRISP